MPDEYERELGEMDGRGYSLFIKVWPSWNDPEEFVVAVVCRWIDPDTGERESEQIARIENRAHGRAHVDRLWTKEQDMEPFDGGWPEAWRRLEENWEKYARRYDRNRGGGRWSSPIHRHHTHLYYAVLR